MNKQPNYHRAFAIFVCFILTILVIGLAVDQKEMHDMKANESSLQARIAELETENANLQAEIDALIERAETAESSLAELQDTTQVASNDYVSSYYDSEYDGMSAQDYIAWRESGANYDARNGQYIGKYQLSADKLNGDYSPENQEHIAEEYMLDRYGSWENARDFWNEHGWW